MLLAESAGAIPGADITVPPAGWLAFFALVTALLLADLLLLHREAKAIGLREAAISSAGWIALGVGFTAVVWIWLGGAAAGQYFTGYVIEKSLSVDNVFVWAVIFSYFSVPDRYQHRVLFWGIFGALSMRLGFIFAGVALLEKFEWVIYAFGLLLLVTAVRVVRHSGEDIHPERNPALRLLRRVIPITDEYHETRFTVIDAGRRYATPLLVVLVLIEASDVVFAVDSVPAVLAVTRSEFLVFSSNALAILGLRALYFLLAGAADRLVYLNVGLGVILAFVGVKMLAVDLFHVSTLVSLSFVAVVLTVTVVASLLRSRRHDTAQATAIEPASPTDTAGDLESAGSTNGTDPVADTPPVPPVEEPAERSSDR